MAEFRSRASFFFEIVFIEFPTSPLDRDGLRASLGREGFATLTFVEAKGDGPAALIEAINEALRLAARAKLDAILIEPHILLNHEALGELCAVSELDPMIGFVEAAASNQDDQPQRDQHCSGTRSEVNQVERLTMDMPRLSYVPIVEAPLLLIKARMLQEFDLLDSSWNSLTCALNDFALRANRCAYRVVRANDARVPSLRRETQERREPITEQSDFPRLQSRFPYLAKEMQRYRDSPDRNAAWLLAGLRPNAAGRLRIVFACNYLSKIHNGTSELTRRVISEFSRNHASAYDIHILCSEDAFHFHAYHELGSVSHLSSFSEEDPIPFFAAIRLVQPFDDGDISLSVNVACVTMFLILDTIALDCMYIAPALERVWERMLKCTSALGFISDFSRAQFDRRFPHRGEVIEFTALCSTDAAEYDAHVNIEDVRDDGYILLVGNTYDHKFIKESCDHFVREAPDTRLVVLGLDFPKTEQISSYESGLLNAGAVADLYARASLVFFPSHDEGFGLPILHGLARRKPVVARDLPVFREIRQRLPEARNLHLLDTTAEMVRFAATRPIWDSEATIPPSPVQRWASMAKVISDALMEAGKKVTFGDLRGRLVEAQACREIASLEALVAERTKEIALMKLSWEPPADVSDMPAQAARFASKRLEGGLRRFLGWKWTYAVTRFGWRLATMARKGRSAPDRR